jgi:hypothetical protein
MENISKQNTLDIDNEQAFVGRDQLPGNIYGEFRVKALRLELLIFSGSCISTNESLFILSALPTLAKTDQDIYKTFAMSFNCIFFKIGRQARCAVTIDTLTSSAL